MGIVGDTTGNSTAPEAKTMHEADPDCIVTVPVTYNNFQDVARQVRDILSDNSTGQGLRNDLVRDKPDHPGAAAPVDRDLFSRRHPAPERGRESGGLPKLPLDKGDTGPEDLRARRTRTGLSITQKSARIPGTSAPRSGRPNRSAADRVAIRIASSGVIPHATAFPDTAVDMPISHEEVRMAVISGKAAAGYRCRGYYRNELFDICSVNPSRTKIYIPFFSFSHASARVVHS